MNLSFSKTIDPLLSGKKTVTRRIFKPKQITAWQNAWDEGRKVHFALDKVTFLGGKMLGWIELKARPYLERMRDMPHIDLEAEGGMVDSIEGFAKLIGVSDLDTEVLVIRFSFQVFDVSRLYFPSNSGEGHWFEESWCGSCASGKEGTCPILFSAHSFDADHPNYPRQWMQAGAGHRICTGWTPRKKVRRKSPPKNKKQLSLLS